MKMSQASKDVRLRMDAILALAKAWGIGPHADCGGDTCRLTSPCGWTVCGKTTNSCVQIPNLDTIRINPVPLGKIKVKAKVR